MVVMLVVVMVSPHPMGPSGCREMKEDGEVAKGGEKQRPDAAGLLGGAGEREREETPGKLAFICKAVFSGRHLLKSVCIVIRCSHWRLQTTGNVLGCRGQPLTLGTDDLGPVPLAITLAPDYGHVVLGKAFVAPVAYSGVDVILGLAGTDGRSVLHCWRGATQHWGRGNLQLVAITGDEWFPLWLGVTHLSRSCPLPSCDLPGLAVIVSVSSTQTRSPFQAGTSWTHPTPQFVCMPGRKEMGGENNLSK